MIKINIDAVVQPVKRTKVLIKNSYAKGTNMHAQKKRTKSWPKQNKKITVHSTACKPRHKRLKQTISQFFKKKTLPTVKMHLRVFLTLMWFLMSQSTSTPPLGPTKVLTTYGKAARNPVYKEIAIPLAFQFFSFFSS